jgi:hypothetical protein
VYRQRLVNKEENMEIETILSVLRALTQEEWRNDYGLRNLIVNGMDMVESLLVKSAPPWTAEEREMKKVEGIKAYRDRTGVSLRMAYLKFNNR